MAALANSLKLVNWTQMMYYPREAYTFLEKSDNPGAKLAFQAINSDPVQSAWKQFTDLLSKYSHLLIPLLGIAFQLYMSSKARAWAERRQERAAQQPAASTTSAPAAAPSTPVAAGQKTQGSSSATKASGGGKKRK